MAHEGTKSYGESFDLVHRSEAEAPNAIWQADHTELDILVKDEHGNARRPWLTIILDDYSGAVAGYILSLAPPSAISNGTCVTSGYLPKTSGRLARLRHSTGALQRSWKRLHVKTHRAGSSRSQNSALLLHSRETSRAGKDRALFRIVVAGFLSRLQGYGQSEKGRPAILPLLELESYLLDEYLVMPYRTTGQAPQARWEAGGFFPQMPESLEKLDLLLLTVPKTRRVRPDGIHFIGMRYIYRLSWIFGSVTGTGFSGSARRAVVVADIGHQGDVEQFARVSFLGEEHTSRSHLRVFRPISRVLFWASMAYNPIFIRGTKRPDQ